MLALLFRLFMTTGVALASATLGYFTAPNCQCGICYDCVTAMLLFTAGCLLCFAFMVHIVCLLLASMDEHTAECERYAREHRLQMMMAHPSMSTHVRKNTTRPRGFHVSDWTDVVFVMCSVTVAVLLMSVIPTVNAERSTDTDVSIRPTRVMFGCVEIRSISASTAPAWNQPSTCWNDHFVIPALGVSNGETYDSLDIMSAPVLELPRTSVNSDSVDRESHVDHYSARSRSSVFARKADVIKICVRILMPPDCSVFRVSLTRWDLFTSEGMPVSYEFVVTLYSPYLEEGTAVNCVTRIVIVINPRTLVSDSDVYAVGEPDGSNLSISGRDAESALACGRTRRVRSQSNAISYVPSVVDVLPSLVVRSIHNSYSVTVEDVSETPEVRSEIYSVAVVEMSAVLELLDIIVLFDTCPLDVEMYHVMDSYCCVFEIPGELVVTTGDDCGVVIEVDFDVSSVNDTFHNHATLNMSGDSVPIPDLNADNGSYSIDFNVLFANSTKYVVSWMTSKFKGFKLPTVRPPSFSVFPSISFTVSGKGWYSAIDYLNGGYMWEIVINVVTSVFTCPNTYQSWLGCVKTTVMSARPGMHINNNFCILASIILSITVASLVLLVVRMASQVRLPRMRDPISRITYTLAMFGGTSIVLSAIGVRLIDVLFIVFISMVSGVPYGLNADDKLDGCLLAVFVFPMVVCVFMYQCMTQITRCGVYLLRRRRIAVLFLFFCVSWALGWFGPSAFLRIGIHMRGTHGPTPLLWVVLASVSSACMSAVRAVVMSDVRSVHAVLIGIHVFVARWYTLLWTGILSMTCFVLCSDNLWSHSNVMSIPHILVRAGTTSRLISLKLLSPTVCIKVVSLWVLVHMVYVVITELNALIYRSLMVGYTYRNVALVYRQYSSWRLTLARWCVPNRIYRNVYWLTATTGAGKTTVDVYCNFVVDDLLRSGLGFNVIDVDGCVRSVSAPTAKGLADSRLSATGHGGLDSFLTAWIPIARKFIVDELASIMRDPRKSKLPTLIMIHVPLEGELLELPLCNFLGHVHVSDEEAYAVASARSRDVHPDVTMAFIKSDEYQNAGLIKIDWPDVQHYLAPVKGIIDLPLAILPDLDISQVFVRVDSFQQPAHLDGRSQITASLDGVPLMAIVTENAFIYKWGLVFVRADVFGDIKGTIMDTARDRRYYDDIPLKKDGRVNWRLIGDVPITCVVYRMELPSRHGRRGLSPSVRLRIELMGVASRDEAEAHVQRRLVSSGTKAIAMKGPVYSGGSTITPSPRSVTQSDQVYVSSRDVDNVVTRELNAIGVTGLAPTPPLGQFQSSAPPDKFVIQGKEWADDGTFVYKGRDVMPPLVPPRHSAVSPCPAEVGKVVEIEGAMIPWSPMEALRRYIPASMAKHVRRIMKHGDPASRARNVRTLKGWVIEFDTEVAKKEFFRSLPDGTCGLEIVANPESNVHSCLTSFSIHPYPSQTTNMSRELFISSYNESDYIDAEVDQEDGGDVYTDVVSYDIVGDYYVGGTKPRLASVKLFSDISEKNVSFNNHRDVISCDFVCVKAMCVSMEWHPLWNRSEFMRRMRSGHLYTFQKSPGLEEPVVFEFFKRENRTGFNELKSSVLGYHRPSVTFNAMMRDGIKFAYAEPSIDTNARHWRDAVVSLHALMTKHGFSSQLASIETILNACDPKTSPGFPSNLSVGTKGGALRALNERTLVQYFNGRIIDSRAFFCGFVRTQVQSRTKHKNRVILATDSFDQFGLMHIMHDFMEKFTSLAYDVDWPFTVGDSAFNYGPDRQVRKLYGVDGITRLGDGSDVSGWDGSLPGVLIKIVAGVAFKYVEMAPMLQGMSSSKLGQAYDNIIDSIINGRCIFPWGEVLLSKKGMKSGTFVTALFNSLAHYLIRAAAFFQRFYMLDPTMLSRLEHEYGTADRFKLWGMIRMTISGDDNRSATPVSMRDTWPPSVFISFYRSLGMVVKDSSTQDSDVITELWKLPYNSRIYPMVAGKYVVYRPAHVLWASIVYPERERRGAMSGAPHHSRLLARCVATYLEGFMNIYFRHSVELFVAKVIPPHVVIDWDSERAFKKRLVRLGLTSEFPMTFPSRQFAWHLHFPNVVWKGPTYPGVTDSAQYPHALDALLD